MSALLLSLLVHYNNMNANANTFVPRDQNNNNTTVISNNINDSSNSSKPIISSFNNNNNTSSKSKSNENKRYFAIDVECVCTGYTHNDRVVAQIAICDIDMGTLLNVFVLNPEDEKKIVSCITPLTGIDRGKLQREGIPFADAMVLVRRCIPRENSVLVGQNVAKDIEWLQLKEGVDFGAIVDLAGVWRTWNPKFKTFSVFSQDHLIRTLLADKHEMGETHDAIGDAVKSMKLFALWRELHIDPKRLEKEKEKLLEKEPEPSFAKRFPSYEGVCMGNRKTCTCNAPFLDDDDA